MCSTFKGYTGDALARRRGGPPPTRPTVAIAASPTASVSHTIPQVGGILLAVMRRSQVNDPEAQNLRPLIAELTVLATPLLPA